MMSEIKIYHTGAVIEHEKLGYLRVVLHSDHEREIAKWENHHLEWNQIDKANEAKIESLSVTLEAVREEVKHSKFSHENIRGIQTGTTLDNFTLREACKGLKATESALSLIDQQLEAKE